MRFIRVLHTWVALLGATCLSGPVHAIQQGPRTAQLVVEVNDTSSRPIPDEEVWLLTSVGRVIRPTCIAPGTFRFERIGTEKVALEFTARSSPLEVALEAGPAVWMTVTMDPDSGRVKSVRQKVYDPPRVNHAKRSKLRGTNSPVGVVPPVNDDCENSLVLLDGDTAFSTIDATTDGPSHATCQFNGQTYNDIWFTYSATCTGTLTVSTCGQADYDTDLVIYDGADCADLEDPPLACNDDFPGCAGFTSTATADVVAGQDYLVRVGGFGLDDEGTGILTVSCEGAPLEDECAFAAAISCGDSVAFDNSLSTTDPGDPAFTCRFGGAGQGRGTTWFTFVAEDTSAFLSTEASSVEDTLLAVYEGTCGSLVEIGCSDDEGVGLLAALCVTNLTVGDTYYVQVASYDSLSKGPIVLDITCPCPPPDLGRCCLEQAPPQQGPRGTLPTRGGKSVGATAYCVDETLLNCLALGGTFDPNETCASSPCPDPPPNDDCSNAIDVGALPASFSFDTSTASTDIVMACGVLIGPFNNAWYKVIGTGNVMTATTCNVGTAVTDTKISVFCGDCFQPTCVAGNDDDDVCGVGNRLSTVSWCTEPGAVYLVTAGMFSTSTTPGAVQVDIFDSGTPCVATVPCLPEGACCVDGNTCSRETEADCDGMGGTYQGDGTDCVVNAVTDPGFEGFTPNPDWTETSTNFGTPICSLAQCGNGGGTGPRNGFVWAWFGGVLVPESASLEQSVTIPTDATTLDFYLEIPVSSGNGLDYVRVLVDGNMLFEAFEGDPVYSGLGYQLVSLDITAFADGTSHQLRFESQTFGPEVSNFFIDDVSILSDSFECGVITIDFETEDDFVTPLVNGQDISTPPEFGNVLAISGTGNNLGPAIFDSDPFGPNAGMWPRDPDLLVDLGNLLILQEDPKQTFPGIFDHPDDAEAGGTIVLDLVTPREPISVILVDICGGAPIQDAAVILFDGSGLTRTYFVPGGWTTDISEQGPPGYGTLGLNTLNPQPGYAATATASEDPGFDSEDVIRIEVFLSASGAVDDLVLR